MDFAAIKQDKRLAILWIFGSALFFCVAVSLKVAMASPRGDRDSLHERFIANKTQALTTPLFVVSAAMAFLGVTTYFAAKKPGNELRDQ